MRAASGETVGLSPLLPWPLSRWRGWTEPIAAERLAAFRIGLASVLFLDLLTTLLPYAEVFFGPEGLEKNLRSPIVGSWLLLVWLTVVVLLLFGLASQFSAAVAWLFAVSFQHHHPSLTSAGDVVCSIGLFYLMLSPCGAVWSLDARFRRRVGPLRIPPWPLRLLFVQLVLMYFCNGLHKLAGPEWRSGEALYRVLADFTLTRWSYAQFPVPHALTQVLTWTVLAWELSFPLLVCWKWTRRLTLGFGVLFHLTLLASMELGWFPLYALCLYLPLVPWEQYTTISGLLPHFDCGRSGCF